MYNKRSGPLPVKVIHVSPCIHVIEGVDNVTVLGVPFGVPILYLCIQYWCLSLSMSSV